MKNRTLFKVAVAISAVLIFTGCAAKSNKEETVKIAVGYQTVTAQTWGPLIMKNQKFLENELESEFPDKKFEIEWQNAQSGPPLTNNMIAGKLQFAVMGDMPVLTNGEKGETQQNYSSVFLGFDGKGKDGKNQAILVPTDSEIENVSELVGHQVATPVGSSAHRMLLDELNKNGIADETEIISQDATVGLSNIKQNKVTAFAIWEPFASLAEEQGYGRVLVNGDDTEVDYLDGIVADKNWVEKNKEYTICFMKALVRSHEFIKENPEKAAEIFAEESGYDLSVCEKMVENITFEAIIYDRDRDTLESSKEFLKELGSIKDVDLDQFIDDSYLRKAYEELGMEYPDADQLSEAW